MSDIATKISTDEILEIAKNTRREFEESRVDKDLLARLYLAYNQVEDINSFIKRADLIFPSLNCGLASAYIQGKIECGEIVLGHYHNNPHSFLLLDEGFIVDITADQFGGPKIYVGPLTYPWSV